MNRLCEAKLASDGEGDVKLVARRGDSRHRSWRSEGLFEDLQIRLALQFESVALENPPSRGLAQAFGKLRGAENRLKPMYELLGRVVEQAGVAMDYQRFVAGISTGDDRRSQRHRFEHHAAHALAQRGVQDHIGLMNGRQHRGPWQSADVMDTRPRADHLESALGVVGLQNGSGDRQMHLRIGAMPRRKSLNHVKGVLHPADSGG